MKELSIEEKAERYDEAVKAAESLCKITTSLPIKEYMESIFPELKESEDEKIRNQIIEHIKWSYDEQECAEEEMQRWISWLEKKSEQPQGKSALEAAKEEKVDNQNCVKPNDKVESKFKVKKGEWYVCTNTFVLKGKIIAIKGKTYQSKQEDDTITCEDNCLFIDRHDGKAFDYFRLWTIQDAKDGDVLADDYGIYIFEKFDECDKNCYVCIGAYQYSQKVYECEHMLCSTDAHPATKEQRDLLFKKMREAGYEWDAEKKELKKIEQKPAEWNEKDENIFENLIELIEQSNDEKGFVKFRNRLKSLGLQNRCKSSAWSEEDEKFIKRIDFWLYSRCKGREYEEIHNWLESLKDRVQPQPKQECSEEDESMRTRCIGILGKCYMGELPTKVEEELNWLKSLNPQNTWKPSDEQMKALKEAVDEHFDIDGGALWHLYEQLKKLREE